MLQIERVIKGIFCASIKGMLKLNYNLKVAISRNVGKKDLVNGYYKNKSKINRNRSPGLFSPHFAARG
jgi:hypothetical protein